VVYGYQGKRKVVGRALTLERILAKQRETAVTVTCMSLRRLLATDPSA
jgi:hypothetical protein